MWSWRASPPKGRSTRRQGAIHSINVSGSGGVPKVSVKATMVNFEGLEGDYNRFRTERKAGDPGRAV